MCILLAYRYNSKAIGAYIVLIHNESDTIVTKEIYLNMSMCCESETCLTGLSSGNYTLYIYDLESQSGPVCNVNFTRSSCNYSYYYQQSNGYH